MVCVWLANAMSTVPVTEIGLHSVGGAPRTHGEAVITSTLASPLPRLKNAALGSPALLLGLEGVPLLGLHDRAQALRDELGQMGMLLEHARDQERTFGRCHLGDMKRIDDVEVELDGLRRLAVAELEDTEGGAPSNRITITRDGPQVT